MVDLPQRGLQPRGAGDLVRALGWALVALVGLYLAHDASYTDSSGKACETFVVGPREVDLCHD